MEPETERALTRWGKGCVFSMHPVRSIGPSIIMDLEIIPFGVFILSFPLIQPIHHEFLWGEGRRS
ncbi:MAG: hypothetical protein PVF22_03485, partial [Candidatus Aminicenantes bacterium]